MYFVAQENLPLVKYEEINKLCEVQGLDIPVHYRCTTSGREILDYIVNTIRIKLLRELHESPFFGFSIDKSEDNGKQENLIIILRYLKNEEVVEKFLKLVTIESADAGTIFDIVYKFFRSENLIHKIIGIATDREPTMAGKTDGFTGRFLRRLPQLVHFHCLPHKLVLQVEDSLKSNTSIKQNLQSLYKLSKFFHGSSKRFKLLQKNEILRGEGPNMNLVVPLDVRWLSYFDAIERLLESFQSVYQTLKGLKASDIYAETLFTQISSFDNIFLLLLVADLVDPIHILSKVLQNNALMMEQVNVAYKACITRLEVLSEGNLGSRCQELFDRLRYKSPTTSYFRECELTHSDTLDCM